MFFNILNLFINLKNYIFVMKEITAINKLVSEIKPYVPATIVMTAKAYRDPKMIESTIINVYGKSIRSFLEAFPKYKAKMDKIESVREHIEDIIMHRILIS